MEEELEIFTSSTCYIESLFNCRKHCLLNRDTVLSKNLLDKLDKVIEAELDLALLGAEKAKQKATKNKDNIKAIIKDD